MGSGRPSPVDIELGPRLEPGFPALPARQPGDQLGGWADHPADIVMTYDNATQVWLVSRRDAETGLFVGDIAVMTASTAYFIRTDNFQELTDPAAASGDTAAAPPPPPPCHHGGEGLEPGAGGEQRRADADKAYRADDYFGTLGGGATLAG